MYALPAAHSVSGCSRWLFERYHCSTVSTHPLPVVQGKTGFRFGSCTVWDVYRRYCSSYCRPETACMCWVTHSDISGLSVLESSFQWTIRISGFISMAGLIMGNLLIGPHLTRSHVLGPLVTFAPLRSCSWCTVSQQSWQASEKSLS